MMMKAKKEIPAVKVVQGDIAVTAEILASAIVDISTGMEAFAKSRLQRRTIIVLLQELTGLSKTTIALVLNSLEALKREFVK